MNDFVATCQILIAQRKTDAKQLLRIGLISSVLPRNSFSALEPQKGCRPNGPPDFGVCHKDSAGSNQDQPFFAAASRLERRDLSRAALFLWISFLAADWSSRLETCRNNNSLSSNETSASTTVAVNFLTRVRRADLLERLERRSLRLLR